jgi:hypothetical protein
MKKALIVFVAVYALGFALTYGAIKLISLTL